MNISKKYRQAGYIRGSLFLAPAVVLISAGLSSAQERHAFQDNM